MAAKEIPHQGTIRLEKQAGCRFYDADNSHYVGFKSPSAGAASVDYVWPDGPPSGREYVLSSDTSGNLSWVTREDVTGEDVYSGTATGDPDGSTHSDFITGIPLETGKDTYIKLYAMGRRDPYDGSMTYVEVIFNALWNGTDYTLAWQDVFNPGSYPYNLVVAGSTAKITIAGLFGTTIYWKGYAKVLTN